MIRLMFVLLLAFSLAWSQSVLASSSFSDIASSYAEKEISELARAGILSGFNDGSFHPEQSVTRAELSKVLVKLLGLKEDPEPAAPFRDVSEGDWFAGYVGALVKSGIAQGTSDDAFSPSSPVTREEMAVFYIRALGLGRELSMTAEVPVSDVDEISPWAVKHVSLAFKIGLLQGIDTPGGLKFAPRAYADRQALARVSYDFMINKSHYAEQAIKEIEEEGKSRKPGQQEREEKPKQAGSGNTPGSQPASPAASSGGGGGGSPGPTSPADTTPPEVLSAAVVIGGQQYAAEKIGNNRFSFVIPADLEGSRSMTSFVIRASADADRLSATFLGETKSVTFDGGTATASTSDLLGPLDAKRDGVSVASIRKIIGVNQLEIAGLIRDEAGNTSSVILVLSAN
jgi:hypothetical protein